MSVPHFDEEVELERVKEEGIPAFGLEFTVSGPLRPEDQSEILRVLISVWQTSDDIKNDGSGKVVAKALGTGTQDPNDPTKWIARMTTLGPTRFQPDRPATGLGHLVSNDGEDPTGFETYTWISRLTMKPQP
jgi:hypothetical protein